MAQAVEGDFLCDSCGFKPDLERFAGMGAAQSFEHKSTAWFSTI